MGEGEQVGLAFAKVVEGHKGKRSRVHDLAHLDKQWPGPRGARDRDEPVSLELPGSLVDVIDHPQGSALEAIADSRVELRVVPDRAHGLPCGVGMDAHWEALSGPGAA